MPDAATKKENVKATHHTGNGDGRIPFKISSRQNSRQSFTTISQALSTSSVNLSPIQINPTGFIRFITLQINIAATGGTSVAFATDGPFNVISNIAFKNAAGNDLIAPVTGYQLMLMNKYGCPAGAAPYSDPKANFIYKTDSSGNATLILTLGFEIDPATGYGSIPALSGAKEYQLNISLNALASVYSSAPTSATVTISAITDFWTEPPSHGPHGHAQATHPNGVGSYSQWQIESPSVNSGNRDVRSNSVGNLIRTMIFVARNSSGVRSDSIWPATCTFEFDNYAFLYLPQTKWEWDMSRFYGFTNSSQTKDVSQSLDTGVYVIPFFAMTQGIAGMDGHRGQYLSTQDDTVIKLLGNSWGSGMAGLEILTQSIVPSAGEHEAGGPAAAFYGNALRHQHH